VLAVELRKVTIPRTKAREILLLMLQRSFSPQGTIDFSAYTDLVTPFGSYDLEKETDALSRNQTRTELHFTCDQKDPLFGTLMTVGIVSSGTGVGATISTEFLGKSVEVSGPGFIENAERSLTNDILLFRREFTEMLKADKFADAFRLYRSFLFTSIALVELFINRYQAYWLHNPATIKNSDAMKALSSSVNLEKRLDAWFKLAGVEKSLFDQTAEWNNFKKIKVARNELVHNGSIGYSYQIKNISKVMNASSKGIGGFLSVLHGAAGFNPHLGFMLDLVYDSVIEIGT